jgi:hypothetical protein
MRRFSILNLAFLMLLAAIPMISIGALNDAAALWAVGLIVLLIGFLIPIVLRFVHLVVTPKDEPDVGEEPG